MAGINFSQVTVPVSTGSTDVTVSGFGTPKAAIFIWSQDEITGGGIVGRGQSYGFTDGINHRSIGSYARSGWGTTDVRRAGSDTYVVIAPGHLGVAALIETTIGFTQWVTDGVRLNVTTSYPGSFLTVVFMSGDDLLNIKAGTTDLGTTLGAQSETGVGFNANMLFGISAFMTASAYDLLNGNTANSIGCAVDNASGLVQRCTQYGDRSGESTTKTDLMVSTQTTWGRVTNNAVGMQVAVTGFTPTGFNINKTVLTPANQTVFWLAIEFNDIDQVAVVSDEWPIGGTSEVTGLSFEPAFGLKSTVDYVGSYNTHTINTGQGLYTVPFTGLECRSISSYDLAGVTTSSAMSQSVDDVGLYRIGNAGNYVTADQPVMNSDGWTFPNTSNSTAVGRGWSLAIGPGGTPPVGIQEMYIKDGGIFVKYTPYVKVGGTFQEVDAYVLEGGAWVPVHEK